MRNRAGVILIESNNVALIERQRAGDHYFAFPGGGVDKGETPEQAAIREAKEELGLQVRILQKAIEIDFGESHHFYFLVECVSGEFGTGNGEEYAHSDSLNTYLPIWMPIDELIQHDNIYPVEVAKWAIKSGQAGLLTNK
jgi:8-oxo-dGTP diphosphatase